MTAALATALIDGLLTGAVYALVALGFTLIYNVLHLWNLAHGSLLMLAMLLAWILAAAFGIAPYASLPLITLALFATGYALYAGLIQPVARGRTRAAIWTTAGIAIALQAAALALFGGAPRMVRMPSALHTVPVGLLLVGVPRLAGAAGATMVGAMLFVFMTRTDAGRSIRAIAHEPVAACLVGIRPAHTRALAYGVGVACLGAAGCLLLPSTAVSPQSGLVFLLIGLTASVLGGLGSLQGAIVGGLVVGVAERLGALLPGHHGGLLGIAAVLLAALLLRPARLFSHA